MCSKTPYALVAFSDFQSTSVVLPEIRKLITRGRFKIGPSGTRDTQQPYVDNPESFRDKPELREGLASRLREYKAVFVTGDADLSRRSRTKAEVSQFSDEITVNCAPLV